jgi:septal ring factor EnvC (AmiA/AmiB activator)
MEAEHVTPSSHVIPTVITPDLTTLADAEARADDAERKLEHIRRRFEQLAGELTLTRHSLDVAEGRIRDLETARAGDQDRARTRFDSMARAFSAQLDAAERRTIAAIDRYEAAERELRNGGLR